jgi:hypothetical protein
MKSFLGLSTFITISLILSLLSNGNSMKIKITPNGQDLKNHFGAPKEFNKYGPQENPYNQYIEANPDSFIPLKTNNVMKIEKQLRDNQNVIKSGDFKNIAPSAQTVIKPEIAKPRLEIITDLNHPAVVQVPTIKSIKKDFHEVTAYNKETGQIVKDKVILSKPEIVLEPQVNIFKF